MTTTSTRLGLKRHTLSDTFRIQDYDDNWGRLDQYPGVYPCLSSARPTWGAGQAGMLIFETDTKLAWSWDGVGWNRVNAKGLLNSSERTANLSNSAAGTYANLVSASVDIPAGDRSVLVTVEGASVVNTAGVTQFGIFRDATLLQEWNVVAGGAGATALQQPIGFGMTVKDTPTAGTGQNFILKFRPVVGFGGTSTVTAGANAPCAIHVVEV